MAAFFATVFFATVFFATVFFATVFFATVFFATVLVGAAYVAPAFFARVLCGGVLRGRARWPSLDALVDERARAAVYSSAFFAAAFPRGGVLPDRVLRVDVLRSGILRDRSSR